MGERSVRVLFSPADLSLWFGLNLTLDWIAGCHDRFDRRQSYTEYFPACNDDPHVIVVPVNYLWELSRPGCDCF